MAAGTGRRVASVYYLPDGNSQPLLGCFGALPALGNGHEGAVEPSSTDQG